MNNEQGRKGRGCFFYGCMTLVVIGILAVLVVVAGYIGVRYAVNRIITTYTETTPLTLPVEAISEAEAAQLQERVETFSTALRNGQATAPLELTDQELNALIARQPELKQIKDMLYVSLAGDEIRGQISIPLERLGLKRHKGRYLNGAAAFKVTLENGGLIVTLRSLEVNGREIPAHVISQLSKENLAKDVYRDPRSAEFMRKIESIQVKAGRLIIQPKGIESI